MNLGRSFFASAALAALLGATAPSSVIGCGGYGDCNGAECANWVRIGAAVPPVNGTWTVTVCLNEYCGSGTLTASELRSYTKPNLANLLLESQDGSTWRLTATIQVANPKNGDQVSAKVVDAKGGVIVEGERAITYSKYESSNGANCPEKNTCYKAELTIP